MLDSLSYFVGIFGTVVGAAGAIALVIVSLLLAVVIKRLPQKLRRAMSAFAASVVLFTIFRELAIQNWSFVFYKALSPVDIAATISKVYFFLIVISVLLCEACVRRERVLYSQFQILDKLCQGKCDAHCAGEFSPSLILKVSSVILQ